MADEHHEALRRLEERLGQASAAADRLAEQAKQAGLGQSRGAAPRGESSQRQANGSERQEGEGSGHRAHGWAKPPPAGWQTPPNERASASPGAELDALLDAIRSMRELIPAEVLQRLAEALKEVLLALRTLIDHYVERLEHRRREPPEVEEIPIL